MAKQFKLSLSVDMALFIWNLWWYKFKNTAQYLGCYFVIVKNWPPPFSRRVYNFVNEKYFSLEPKNEKFRE